MFDPAGRWAWCAAATASSNGLIMRAVGDRMIIAPPLVMSRAQIDEMMALIRRCLDLTLRPCAAMPGHPVISSL
jgi:putrescine aminotransferase